MHTVYSEEHRHQERHGQRVGEERGQHVDEQLHHQVKRHALGDHQLGEVIDAVDDEEEGEERAAEEKRRDQLSDEVAVDDGDRSNLHASVVP